MVKYSGIYSHIVKCSDDVIGDVITGVKKHEVRVFDRKYRVGDRILMIAWPSQSKSVDICITHITKPGEWGLPENIGVFSFELMEVNVNNHAGIIGSEFIKEWQT